MHTDHRFGLVHVAMLCSMGHIVWGTMRCHQPRVDDTGTNTGRQVTILSLRQPVSVVDSSAESAIEEP